MLSTYLSLVNTEQDRQKVTYIYENYYSYMSYTAGQYLKNRHDIEDAVHNTMLKIIENIEYIDLSDDVKSKSLCGIIAKNKAIDFLRNKDNQTLSIEDYQENDFNNEAAPDSIIIKAETVNAIEKAIDSLNEVYRDVCRLKYVNELKEREIAHLLDLPDKTVNMRIFRGKQQLREILKKENIYV